MNHRDVDEQSHPDPVEEPTHSNTVNGDVTGDVFQAGVVHGDVHIHGPGAPVRSSYLRFVREIAPEDGLVDRERELAELAEFCCSEDNANPYLWLRAPAWAGKSALMAWFVLHPPNGIRVASFFITARLAAHNTREAFLDVVLEQMAILSGEPIPEFRTPATLPLHLGAMLDAAAHACAARGERLVLVLDGLDEDRGATAGSDRHSIATLLPREPKGRMRVIVTGRPNPPIPVDVPDNHPLRDPVIVRSLSTSPQARVIRQDMERELDHLLEGTEEEQDLLGLLTAAGGGLTADDLGHLTQSSRKIEKHLAAVAGRTFTTRPSLWRPGIGPDMYILGHEEIHVAAATLLGPQRLAVHRASLLRWADEYRDKGWPPDTPEYLLGGYFAMISGADPDLPRMAACATDPGRHDLLLVLSGSDSAALREIDAAQDAVLRMDGLDAHTMARLALHRDHIIRANAHIPEHLPAIRARLGEISRAVALADVVPPLHRLAALIELLAACDDNAADTAADLVDRIGALIEETSSPIRQGWALVGLVKALVARGAIDQASSVALSVASPRFQSQAVRDVVRALDAQGDTARAVKLSRSIMDPECRANVLVGLGQVPEAEQVAAIVKEDGARSRAVTSLVWAAVAQGDLQRAETLANSISDTALKAWTLGSLAPSVVASGDAYAADDIVDRALCYARSVADTGTQSWALGGIALAVAACGDLTRAADLCGTITDAQRRLDILLGLAAAASRHGERGRAINCAREAEDVAGSIDDPDTHARKLADVAAVMSSLGDLDSAQRALDQADHLATTIANPSQRARALTGLASSAAGYGDFNRAQHVAAKIEAGRGQSWLMASFATLLLVRNKYEAAEQLAKSISSPNRQVWALLKVARASVLRSDIAAARRITDGAEDIARSTADKGHMLEFMAELLAVAAKSALTENQNLIAEELEHLIALLSAQGALAAPWNVSRLALVLIRAGDQSTGLRLLDALHHRIRQTPNLADRRAAYLKILIRASAALDDAAVLSDLMDEIEAAARDLANPNDRAAALLQLAEEALNHHGKARAVRLVDEIQNRAGDDTPSSIMASLVTVLLQLDAPDRAERLALLISDPWYRVCGLIAVARAMTRHSRLDGAASAINEAKRTALAMPPSLLRAHALGRLMENFWETGDPTWDEVVESATTPMSADTLISYRVRKSISAGELAMAEQHVLLIMDQFARSNALRRLADSTALAGDVDHAEEIARTIEDSVVSVDALVDMSRSTFKSDPMRARRLLDEAEALTTSINNPSRRSRSLTMLAMYAEPPARQRLIVKALSLTGSSWELPTHISIEHDLAGTVLKELPRLR